MACLIFSVIGYYIGRSLGEKFVKNAFDETIAKLKQEQEEYERWVQNGKKLNEVPPPKFELTSFTGFPDPKLEMIQNMGKQIKSLSEKQ